MCVITECVLKYLCNLTAECAFLCHGYSDSLTHGVEFKGTGLRGVDGVECHGDGVVMELGFKNLDGDGALELVFFYRAVMVFN